ncbi:hypothetical protein HYQ19_gp053 [Arthrobacter phage DrYang]|uniref:DNA-binding phage zinc finger domain-containing protein n=1 Tax=Arthrobacter phage DrYang TaxID=2686080 RepID=A0A6B9JE93_9CAUD|nr:hypothetical protein HYQ19_gp053 [Arthrobacter phage DrYang]QGZ17152.1 hypothetical protein SEA_DRYANG_53 [Arthrobacter phage DrYang]
MEGMSNAATALMAAATVHQGRKTPPAAVKLLADSFKNWLDEQDNAWQRVHRVKCPTCSAAPGNVCRDTRDQAPMTHPHATRKATAK